MADFPMDIINELFLRLSASTLVRCRVLSKPCFSLIDSPDFISSHLKRTLQTGDHLLILLRGPRLLRTVELDSLHNVSDIEHPLQAGGSTKVFGSCNGLIGLYNSPTDMALLNPSTRQIHRLPAEPLDFPERHITPEYVFYGLGYDSVNDDYKVVRMLQSKLYGSKENFGFPVEIKVFSLKRNSWKRIYLLHSEVRVPLNYFYYYLLDRRGYGVQANNNLHWVLPRRPLVMGTVNTLIRFDLASEDLRVVDLPKAFYCEDNMDIGVLDGCLWLMSYSYDVSTFAFTNVEVWIRREYEVVGSWTKLYRVPKPDSVESLDYVRPLLYSKDRSKILLEINDAENLMWFDVARKRLTAVGIKECDSSFSAEILVSSLVLGCKGDPTEVKRRKAKMMQKNKKRDDFLSKGFKLKL